MATVTVITAPATRPTPVIPTATTAAPVGVTISATVGVTIAAITVITISRGTTR
ncbi:MAG: hypothetical protein ACE5G5_04865 [Candidatus Methylomirabilales bacterium]